MGIFTMEWICKKCGEYNKMPTRKTKVCKTCRFPIAGKNPSAWPEPESAVKKEPMPEPEPAPVIVPKQEEPEPEVLEPDRRCIVGVHVCKYCDSVVYAPQQQEEPEPEEEEYEEYEEEIPQPPKVVKKKRRRKKKK